MTKKVALTAALLGSLVLASGSALADKMAAGAEEIKGQLTGIDGSFYLIKDAKGVEHRLHFDDTTKRPGEITAGVDVEAYVSNGHVTEIKIEE